MSMNPKHTLIMLACCLIPVGAFTAIFAFNVPINNALLVTLALLCPLSHLLMMKNLPNAADAHREAHQRVLEANSRGETQ